MGVSLREIVMMYYFSCIIFILHHTVVIAIIIMDLVSVFLLVINAAAALHRLVTERDVTAKSQTRTWRKHDSTDVPQGSGLAREKNTPLVPLKHVNARTDIRENKTRPHTTDHSSCYVARLTFQ